MRPVLLFPLALSGQLLAQPSLTAADLSHLKGGWTGELTYINYTDGSPSTIPATLLFEPAGEGLWRIGYGYTEEPHANELDTVALSADGTHMGHGVFHRHARSHQGLGRNHQAAFLHLGNHFGGPGREAGRDQAGRIQACGTGRCGGGHHGAGCREAGRHGQVADGDGQRMTRAGLQQPRHRRHQPQQPPRLRRQFIERAAQDFVRQIIGKRDVRERDLDVSQRHTVFARHRAPLALPQLLQLLRDSGAAQKVMAPAGQYQQNLPQGRTFQLLRLRMDPSLGLIPEISGNRLIVSVRLMQLESDDRLHASTGDTAFELTLCS